MLRCSIVLSLVFVFCPNVGTASPLEILKENCVSCHSPSKRKGGLLIDSRDSLLKGGDSGAAIESGDSGNSYLIETLFPDADSHMPPKNQLKPKEIAALETWIDTGARWDGKLWASLTTPERSKVKLKPFPDLYSPVLAMAVSPNGNTLAAGRRNTIDLYKVTQPEDTKKPIQLDFIKSVEKHLDLVQSLAFSPDGKTIASGGFRRLILHSGENFETTREISDPFLGRLTAISFSPNGSDLLVADSMPAQTAQIHVINPKDLKLRQSIKSAHDDAIYDLCYNAEGTEIASASADKLAIIRDTKKYDIVTTLEGHTSFVLGVAFSPDGKRIATSGDDEVVKVWDAKTGTQISTFSTSKSGPVGGVAWTTDPDNLSKKKKEKDPKKAKEINTDRIVVINDLGQPGTFTELNEHEGEQRSKGAKEKRHDAVGIALTTMAYDPGQLLLFGGSEDGRIFVWDKLGKKIQSLNEPVTIAKAAK